MEVRNPLVSVIIPVYNAEMTIENCVRSVIEQHYTNFEVIIIDDNSTDDSILRIRELMQSDGRINYHKLDVNQGVSFVRNKGIQMAKGEYLLFLDSDDSLPADSISSMVTEALRSDAEVVLAGYTKRYSLTNMTLAMPFNENILLLRSDILAYIFRYLKSPNQHSAFIYCWGRLVKKDLIKKNDIKFNHSIKYSEDIDFNFRLLKHVEKVSYIHKSLYIYSISNEGKSAVSQALFNRGGRLGLLEAMNAAEEYLLFNGIERNMAKELIDITKANYCIVQIIKTVNFLKLHNYKIIYQNCKEWIEFGNRSNSLLVYLRSIRSREQSSMIAFFGAHGFVNCAILAAKYKALIRYGKSTKL